MNKQDLRPTQQKPIRIEKARVWPGYIHFLGVYQTREGHVKQKLLKRDVQRFVKQGVPLT